VAYRQCVAFGYNAHVFRRILVLWLVLAALVAGSATAAQARPVASVVPSCAVGYYKNADGKCVRRPSHDPRGATAQCRDGTYSYSQHASGTCSHHGGVRRWIHHP
jgi:Protein of unknown function (DUF3761)